MLFWGVRFHPVGATLLFATMLSIAMKHTIWFWTIKPVSPALPFTDAHWITLRYNTLHHFVEHSFNFTLELVSPTLLFSDAHWIALVGRYCICTALCCIRHRCNSLSKHMTGLQMQCKLLFERSRVPMLHLGGARCNNCFDASYL